MRHSTARMTAPSERGVSEQEMLELLAPATRESWRDRTGTRRKPSEPATTHDTPTAHTSKTPAHQPSTNQPSTNQQYEFIEELGRDQWSVDHAAFDPQLNRAVTIRVLNEEFQQDETVAGQFWQRAACLAQVEHAHVARIHTIDPARGWIVMERLPRSLEQQIKDDGPLGMDEARRVLQQALAGLGAFHRRNEVHGGLCLSHLKIAIDESIKLSDPPGFTPGGELSLPDQQRRQFAPEMASTREFGEIGPATDLYCLGFAMLQAMMGRDFDAIATESALYDSNPSQAWLRWHASPRQSLPPLSELIPGLPADLDALLTSLTNKRVSQRPASAMDVLTRLSYDAAVPSADDGRLMPPAGSIDLDRTSDGPGAVMVGRLSSVYSDAVEPEEEPDWLTRLADADWVMAQVQRPVVFGPAIAIVAGLCLLLMLGAQPQPATASLASAPSIESDTTEPPPVPPTPPSPPIAQPVLTATDDLSEGEGIGPTEAIVSTGQGRGESRDRDRDQLRNDEPKRKLVDTWQPALPVVPWPVRCLPEREAEVISLIDQLLGRPWDDARHRDQAAEVYDRLTRIAVDEPRVYYAYGLLLAHQGDYLEAERHFHRAAKIAEQPHAPQRSKITQMSDLQAIHQEQVWRAQVPQRERIWVMVVQSAVSGHSTLVEQCAFELEQLTSNGLAGESTGHHSGSFASPEQAETLEVVAHCSAWLPTRFNARIQREISVDDWLHRLREPLSSDDLRRFETLRDNAVTEIDRLQKEAVDDESAVGLPVSTPTQVSFRTLSPPAFRWKRERLLSSLERPASKN